jgi:hypothetical protein
LEHISFDLPPKTEPLIMRDIDARYVILKGGRSAIEKRRSPMWLTRVASLEDEMIFNDPSGYDSTINGKSAHPFQRNFNTKWTITDKWGHRVPNVDICHRSDNFIYAD